MPPENCFAKSGMPSFVIGVWHTLQRITVTRYSPCLTGSSTGSGAFVGFGAGIFGILRSVFGATTLSTAGTVRRKATIALASSSVIRL